MCRRSLQYEFEKWPVVDFEQPIGDVNSVIGVDADQMGIEGRVMEDRSPAICRGLKIRATD